MFVCVFLCFYVHVYVLFFSCKSSLLMDLLDELQILSSHSKVQGSIALASQLPWIFSGTVRENVTFGKEFEADWYENVLSACALDKVCSDCACVCVNGCGHL